MQVFHRVRIFYIRFWIVVKQSVGCHLVLIKTVLLQANDLVNITLWRFAHVERWLNDLLFLNRWLLLNWLITAEGFLWDFSSIECRRLNPHERPCFLALNREYIWSQFINPFCYFWLSYINWCLNFAFFDHAQLALRPHFLHVLIQVKNNSVFDFCNRLSIKRNLIFKLLIFQLVVA